MAIVREGARLDVAVVLHVAKPLGGRVGELCVDGVHAGECAAAGVCEDRLQGLVGGAGRVVAGGGSSALHPCVAEAPLHLAPVGEAVLEVVDRPSGALTEDHVPADVGVRNVRRTGAPVVVPPAGAFELPTQGHSRQPWACSVCRVRGALRAAISLAYLLLAEPLPVGIEHDQRRVDEHVGINAGMGVDPRDGLSHSDGPPRLHDTSVWVQGNNASLVRGDSVCPC